MSVCQEIFLGSGGLGGFFNDRCPSTACCPRPPPTEERPPLVPCLASFTPPACDTDLLQHCFYVICTIGERKPFDIFILLISYDFQSQIWRLLLNIFLNSWLPARWLASLTTVGYRSAVLLLLKISISVPYQSPQSPNKGSWGLELYSFLFHQISLLPCPFLLFFQKLPLPQISMALERSHSQPVEAA